MTQDDMPEGDTTEPWSDRAELYRTSAAHTSGPDLDLIVEWAAGCKTAIDVATGGGHTARRLREAGLEVVSCDPAPGMQPDVICYAEHLPFADGAFDLAVTRVAPHHFADVAEATRELARVASKRVIVVDNLYGGEESEHAERLRDPSHVRNYDETQWRELFAQAGLEIDELRRMDFPIEFEPWLERTGCEGEDADRVRELLADKIDGEMVTFHRIAILGHNAGSGAA